MHSIGSFLNNKYTSQNDVLMEEMLTKLELD
jgi:hypothetical protein